MKLILSSVVLALFLTAVVAPPPELPGSPTPVIHERSFTESYIDPASPAPPHWPPWKKMCYKHPKNPCCKMVAPSECSDGMKRDLTQEAESRAVKAAEIQEADIQTEFEVEDQQALDQAKTTIDSTHVQRDTGGAFNVQDDDGPGFSVAPPRWTLATPMAPNSPDWKTLCYTDPGNACCKDVAAEECSTWLKRDNQNIDPVDEGWTGDKWGAPKVGHSVRALAA